MLAGGETAPARLAIEPVEPLKTLYALSRGPEGRQDPRDNDGNALGDESGKAP